jgi:hypothetical protein
MPAPPAECAELGDDRQRVITGERRATRHQLVQTAPNEYKSARGSGERPSACSGARYAIVPTIMASSVSFANVALSL